MACVGVALEWSWGAPVADGRGMWLRKGKQDCHLSTLYPASMVSHGRRFDAWAGGSSVRVRAATRVDRLVASHGGCSGTVASGTSSGRMPSRKASGFLSCASRTSVCAGKQLSVSRGESVLGAVGMSGCRESEPACWHWKESVLWRRELLKERRSDRKWRSFSLGTTSCDGMHPEGGYGRAEGGSRLGREVEEGEAIVNSEEIRDARMKYLQGGMQPRHRSRVEESREADGGSAQAFNASGEKGGSGKVVEFMEKLRTSPARYVVEEAAVHEKRKRERLEDRTNCSLSEFLSIMRRTQGLPMYATELCFTVTGRQVMFEIEAAWELSWCMDGRFRERFDCEELTLDWGLDVFGSAWEADASGDVSGLDLDDHDLAVLTAWIRSGYWLTAEARSRLQIEFVSEEEKAELKADFKGAMDSFKFISVCVPGRNVKAVVIVEKATCLPKCMRLNVFGTHEVWDFNDWTQIIDHCPFLFPLSTLRHPTAGGDATYIAKALECVSMSNKQGQRRNSLSEMFNRPAEPLPRHNPRYPRRTFDPALPGKLNMTLTESRHNVVRPLVNGKDVGYFMIDTGASGLTIGPEIADSLGMGAFGRLHVTGVQGSMDTQYRVADTFELGPLKITNPIFMEVESHGVIRGPSAVGICGYDIFRDCIVEMSQSGETISFFSHEEFAAQSRGEIPWQELYLIGNVPHAKVSVDGVEELFLIDTGAGGTDIIFHFRAVEKHNLLATHKVTSGTSLRGMGSDTDGVSVVSAKMKDFKVGRHVVKEVSALFSLNKSGGVDLSEYTAGILCGDLLRQFRIIYDYGGRRIAFLPERRRKGPPWRVMALAACRLESMTSLKVAG